MFDERHALPVDDAMVRSIMALGVLEPIIVTRDPETGDVLVVDGRQRVKCAIEANARLDHMGAPLLLVPATTRKGDSDAALMSIMVTTNELRLADPPLVRAAKMQRLKNLGQDDDYVATVFGVNKATVQNTLALLDCGSVVRKAVEGGLIGMSDVKYLSRLTVAQQAAKVTELVRNVAGKEGHARAKAKREVLATPAPGEKAVAPKMKGRKEIAAMIEHARATMPPGVAETYVDALQWVLGSFSTPDAVDTKTAPLFDEASA